MKRDDCIFCKLANGDIPTNTLFEDEDFRVILDASPAAKGHALVLPKDHFANVFEIPEETIAKAARIAKRIAQKQMDTYGCDGINILQNNGEAAGQTVFHYHVHVIPRTSGDTKEVRLTWDQQNLTDEVAKEVVRDLSL